MKTNVRLSKFVIPKKYSLKIAPDLEAFTFAGEEIITLTILKNTRAITIHSKEIEILDGFAVQSKTKTIIRKITYDTESETAILQFENSISSGNAKLHLRFRGIISESLRGFYRSQYVYQGVTKHIATTQFEATDARRAFPCFDEPAKKAVFELSLEIPSHLSAISNTIEYGTPDGVEHSQGYKIVRFAPTPKMSTYLLAYIIGDFETIETKTDTGVKIRVHTTLGKTHQAKFALDVASRSLEFLNNYFEIPYPLPVLDLIAIPDFSSAAMENWGAVTFRESALLIDETHSAFANKQSVAEVIAHELVHQWFGNLVTMEWWTHLWLNESFASFMSYIVIDDLFPEWKFWTRFVLHDHANALLLDSLQNTHPIEVEVHHPSQISEIFDAISYDKGASVLRMLQEYIGPNNFRDGLRHYLKKHSYKNTSSVHLWESFEKISKKPISAFMKQWVSKPGYPLVSIVQTKPGAVKVSQERFSADSSKSSTLWPIPLQLELSNVRMSSMELLTKKYKQFAISSDAKYIKSNPGETGFYRTMYSASLLAKLFNPVKNQELSIPDRFGIIRDLFAIVKAGKIPTSAYLEFLSAYEHEESYIVWTEILKGMSEIHMLVSSDKKLLLRLEAYYVRLLNTVATKVGWEPEHKESQARAMLRSAVLKAYGTYGDAKTLKKAQQVFKNRKTKSIIPDMRASVYALAAKNANSRMFSELQRMFVSEHLQEEQRRIGRSLSLVQDLHLYTNYLDFSISKHVRSQDAPLMIFSALSNPYNRQNGWKWIQKKWNVLYDRYQNDHLLVWIVQSLSDFSDSKTAKEIKVFFDKHSVPSATRAINQVLEKIHLNEAWLKRDKKDISDCIKRA